MKAWRRDRNLGPSSNCILLPFSPTGCSDRSLPAYIWALFRPFGRFSVSEPQQHITLKILLLTAERGTHGVICRWYFPFIVGKFRSVCGAAARRRRVSLWTDGIVRKSSGNNKALHLLLICWIFFCLSRWQPGTGSCNTCPAHASAPTGTREDSDTAAEVIWT